MGFNTAFCSTLGLCCIAFKRLVVGFVSGWTSPKTIGGSVVFAIWLAGAKTVAWQAIKTRLFGKTDLSKQQVLGLAHSYPYPMHRFVCRGLCDTN